MTQKPGKFNRYGLLALFVALAPAMLINQTPLRASSVFLPTVGGVRPEPPTLWIYTDLNQNSQLDPGEYGLEGVEVDITSLDADTVSGQWVEVTDENGAIYLPALAPGVYGLNIAGYTAGVISLTVAPNQDGPNLNIGLFPDSQEPTTAQHVYLPVVAR